MASVIPEVIECQVLHEGEPVPGLMLLVQLKTTRKNPYTLTLGPTNEEGRALLLRTEIEQKAAAKLDFALMDFVPLDEAFSGTVEVSLMREKQLDAALRAYGMFHEFTEYPPDYQATMMRAKEIIRALGPGARFTLHASVRPDSIHVMIPDD
ncbi:MAG: hypothetical protein M1376_09300 [Planctomycetes bacterium]|nr:hypothetical protein [Planctomycetota bacterium]